MGCEQDTYKRKSGKGGRGKGRKHYRTALRQFQPGQQGILEVKSSIKGVAYLYNGLALVTHLASLWLGAALGVCSLSMKCGDSRGVAGGIVPEW